jgi:hypothetical protein
MILVVMLVAMVRLAGKYEPRGPAKPGAPVPGNSVKGRYFPLVAITCLGAVRVGARRLLVWQCCLDSQKDVSRWFWYPGIRGF